MRIHLHLKQRNAVQQRIKRAERAQPLAERTVKQHAAHDNGQQNGCFPGKQCAERGTDAGVDRRQRQRALERSVPSPLLLNMT